MSDRALASDIYTASGSTHSAKTFERLYYFANRSIYRNSSDYAFNNQLMSLREPKIKQLLQSADNYRKLEFAAFAALPLGILAAGLVRQTGTSSLLKPMGITILAASLSCIIISPIANHKKNSNYRQAVRLYNAQF
jgi:hypothetical protein